MAKIYILHSEENHNFIRSLMNNLMELGHELILSDFEVGHDIKTSIKNAMKSADIHIALISNDSLNSNYFMDEVIQIRNYSVHSNSRKLFIPIFYPNIDFSELPSTIRNIRGIMLNGTTENDVQNVGKDIDNAINSFYGKQIAIEEEEKEVKQKIESSAPEYISQTLTDLQSKESNMKTYALIWYGLGFIALIAGVAATIWLSNSGLADFGEKENWSKTIFFAIKSALIIILLIASSKYSFTLGKAYMNETMKIADRIHAISFGKFYLQVFNKRIETEELKDIFRDWNINNQSSFMGQKSDDFDPKLLDKMSDIIDKIKGTEK
ncbi:toll/interleukin-1 receptor domain-containing protein [Aureibaculum sp. A20]|uniref:Toll/interleukin-1 receptor domain-containing protein n=1 Tax=Aureibaculum flavum TaxID=2795986 RepID=A0ABS0WQD0_9FLAO|nr:toll/interleukin-1 receptor domain-containing protein [Aureibaculum flavum]MBJ2174185.1 toll/interleukin-1 receptor domain-containing protein [Aureibaculum flavum]